MRKAICVCSLVSLLALAGCADSSRSLTVNVEEEGVFIICHSTISPEVIKEGNTESPSSTQDVTPSLDLPGMMP